jgi:hypothetical protein
MERKYETLYQGLFRPLREGLFRSVRNASFSYDTDNLVPHNANLFCCRILDGTDVQKETFV